MVAFDFYLITQYISYQSLFCLDSLPFAYWLIFAPQFPKIHKTWKFDLKFSSDNQAYILALN